MKILRVAWLFVLACQLNPPSFVTTAADSSGGPGVSLRAGTKEERAKNPTFLFHAVLTNPPEDELMEPVVSNESIDSQVWHTRVEGSHVISSPKYDII